MEKIYDLIIIGGGPGGLSAGIYAGRSRLDTLLIEKERAGGQIVTTEDVENYPGAMKDATGPALVDRMVEQAEGFGVKQVIDTVISVNLDNKIKIIKGQKGEYKCKSIIISSGAKPRPMGISGEKEFAGKGISYCATCDAPFFEGFDVYVIGGGDSAVEEAIYISKFARKVTIVHRRDKLRAAKSIQEKAFKNEKIDFMWDTIVEEIKGEGIVEEMILKNKKTGENVVVRANEEDGTFGIFVFIGYIPQTDLFKDVINMDDRGYIITDENMHTNIDGVFAVGDCRVKSLRQVVTACADGAIAATQAEKYIEDNFEE
ncbi:thioredoxin-disulfide reductase [Clostridiisalibacter paucivorans]|uniref:thioredoxin-disulfide reductase n=1 Tax=Clostridiisalibacter paucivorans TaxID=408753 RepID=UPI00047E9328|nr:thioredoxin-disulfide reductase [Clostridiisalibacter paucivorans]